MDYIKQCLEEFDKITSIFDKYDAICTLLKQKDERIELFKGAEAKNIIKQFFEKFLTEAYTKGKNENLARTYRSSEMYLMGHKNGYDKGYKKGVKDEIDCIEGSGEHGEAVQKIKHQAIQSYKEELKIWLENQGWDINAGYENDNPLYMVPKKDIIQYLNK